MKETQHLLAKVRPPRVQITYDVEIGDAIEMKELPFVMGVISDLSGDRDPNAPLDPLKLRKFVDIDRDSFGTVMEKSNPVISFQVPNVLTNDNTQLNLSLRFQSVDGFDPISVMQQIPAMAALYGVRSRLRDLLTKLDGNDSLDSLLTGILQDPASQAQLKTSLNLGAPATAASSADAQPNSADAQPKKGK